MKNIFEVILLRHFKKIKFNINSTIIKDWATLFYGKFLIKIMNLYFWIRINRDILICNLKHWMKINSSKNKKSLL